MNDLTFAIAGASALLAAFNLGFTFGRRRGWTERGEIDVTTLDIIRKQVGKP